MIKPPSWSAKEPEWLTRLREVGAKAFAELPDEINPLYIKHHEVLNVDEEWISERTEPLENATLPKPFEGLSSSTEEPLILHVDGSPVITNVPERLSSKGLILEPLVEALKKHEGLVKYSLAEDSERPDGEKLLGLSFAAINSGTLVYIPPQIDEEVKVRSIWLLGSEENITCAATLVIASSGTSLSMIDEYYSYDGEGGKFMAHMINVISSDGARVKHALIDSLDNSTQLLVHKRASTKKDSSTMWVGALLGGAITRYKVNNMLFGNGSRCDALEVSLASESQRFDVTVNLNHIGESTTGRVLAKGVGMDKSRTIFKGIIKIEKQAKGTGAYLAEHAMLLSPDARADAIPGLEIESNDVKATHSASVAQIDPEHIWYLMSRGISMEEATKMIALGFFEPVISEIDVTEVRWNIRYLLEKKWLRERGEELDPETLMDIYVEPEDVGKRIEDIFGSHYKYLYKRQ